MRQTCGHFDVGDMRDQRVETRAALGFIQPGHSIRVRGIGRQAIDRLCGHGHKPAAAQDFCGARDGLVMAGGDDVGTHDVQLALCCTATQA